jgi:hypothetical protein
MAVSTAYAAFVAAYANHPVFSAFRPHDVCRFQLRFGGMMFGLSRSLIIFASTRSRK